MTTAQVINYTNNRLKNRYKVIKEDYGINGSWEATYNEATKAIEIKAIEDWRTNTLSIQYREGEAVDRVFNCWMENPED